MHTLAFLRRTASRAEFGVVATISNAATVPQGILVGGGLGREGVQEARTGPVSAVLTSAKAALTGSITTRRAPAVRISPQSVPLGSKAGHDSRRGILVGDQDDGAESRAQATGSAERQPRSAAAAAALAISRVAVLLLRPRRSALGYAGCRSRDPATAREQVGAAREVDSGAQQGSGRRGVGKLAQPARVRLNAQQEVGSSHVEGAFGLGGADHGGRLAADVVVDDALQ